MTLDTLIEVAKNKKEVTVPVTVRLSVELNSTIEDLAENQLSTSKQKMLVALIEQGLKYVENSFKINEIEKVEKEVEEKNFHLFNTNKRYDSRDGIEMYSQGIVSAFYDPWKHEINKIKKDDVVFLYENGVGIIAYGIADGNVVITDRNGDPKEMHYQKLENFKKLENPFKASQIKKTLNRDIVFLRTRTSISSGKILLDTLEKLKNI